MASNKALNATARSAPGVSAVVGREKGNTMPNGGPDCCGNCGFNKAVQEMAHPHPDQREKFWALSYCTLRAVKVISPFWTYCHNFRYGKRIPDPNERVELKGCISASGLYEGYVRIPWHGKVEPDVSTPCACILCGRKTDKGITVIHEAKEIGFCTNRHYIDWWKTVHDEPNISSNGLATPEEFYKENK